MTCTVIICTLYNVHIRSGLQCPKILISTYASRVKFHKSSFWVLILAAGGPYWVSISQKNGSLSQSLGVPNSFWNSDCAPNHLPEKRVGDPD